MALTRSIKKNSDADLIAAFLAKNEPTRVKSGKRNYGERDMYNAIRGEKVLTADQKKAEANAKALQASEKAFEEGGQNRYLEITRGLRRY